MNNQSILLVIISLMFAGVMYMVLRPRRNPISDAGNSQLASDGAGDFMGCVVVPTGYPKWDEKAMEDSWSTTAEPIKKGLIAFLGYDSVDNDMIFAAHGFFKAIDVMPQYIYVNVFKEELRQWIENDGENRWNITSVGHYRCK